MATPSESDNDSNGTVELSSLKEISENPELKDEIDVFSCPVYLEHFKNPKCLPCQHTFCETCIDAYIQSSQTEYKGDDTLKSFLCPVCRQTVDSPKPDAPPSKWAALLPTDQMVLLQMDNSAKAEDESERLCGPCKRDGESSLGLFWCPNCYECLCEMCRKFHRRMKGFEMHKIVSIESMNDLPKKRANVSEECREHDNEIIKVYCIHHRKMCCVICLAVNHRECKDIKTIDEMTEAMTKNNEDKGFIDSLHDLKSQASQVSQLKQKNVDYLDKRHQDLKEEIKNLIDHAKSNLDNFREDFEETFNSLHKQHHMKILEAKDRVDQFEKALENGVRTLVDVADNGTNKDFFMAKESVKTQLDISNEKSELESELELYISGVVSKLII